MSRQFPLHPEATYDKNAKEADETKKLMQKMVSQVNENLEEKEKSGAKKYDSGLTRSPATFASQTNKPETSTEKTTKPVPHWRYGACGD